MSRPESANFKIEDLRIGLTAEFTRNICQEDVDQFANVSGDFNPLHIDLDYAKSTNFGGTIVHGAFQIGLASALIGMHLPGRQVLLGGVHSRFFNPLPIPSEVMVRGEITAWNIDNLSGQLRVEILKLPSKNPVSEITLSFTMRENQTSTIEPSPRNNSLHSKQQDTPTNGFPLPYVLVTGASGGLGESIATALSSDYRVIAHHHSSPLSDHLLELPNLVPLKSILLFDELEFRLKTILDDNPLFGIIHCAWPGAPHGGLLDSARESIAQQIEFGSLQAIELARMLFKHTNIKTGGRLVFLGSTFGRQHPNITISAYSLGKDILESTTRLLAPELAQRNITVNALAPSVVACGMNSQMDSRSIKRETAGIPLGRLCSTEDISHTVQFLLNQESSFLSGQVISLTGGRL
ncbi:MAG: SDR family oxidoreductase [Verrucomicrobiales bacterium]|nr:SDR family oxidoreductase [Verrucomicrobiales bacterium]